MQGNNLKRFNTMLQKRLERPSERDDEGTSVDFDEVLKPLALPSEKYATVTSVSAVSVASSDNLGMSFCGAFQSKLDYKTIVTVVQ